ncbi:MAG: response regulator [Methylobacterium sp.]|nr:response regulator [Methylobacterium sp.]
MEPQGVLAIGSSAGGLEACSQLLETMPPQHGLALILVQHLDPGHRSLMVDLLARRTSMRVVEAVDGMPILAEHVYVIPPGTYLSIQNRQLQLSVADRLHGARMPFDVLLPALARAYGPRGIAIILSGNGSDGSKGLIAVKEAGGLVLAQDPKEAAFDSMPRSAIATGAVNHVLKVAEMAGVALLHVQQAAAIPPPENAADTISSIITLLRQKTAHDFTGYRRGTIERRIERRMAATGSPDIETYLALLERDDQERETLSNDILINVTAFFRDPRTFALLEEQFIPAMLREHPDDEPFRVWVAGCSTGEEAYSIAILLLDAVAAYARPIRLQIFASDADGNAVTQAREGLYPASALERLRPEQVQRYFVHLGGAYRVKPELRALVVFTEQDILVDPPFSKLDWVSCRNLLIYLGPQAQERVISLIHFALKPGGLLLLGSAESPGTLDGRFTALAKPERIYKKVLTGPVTGSGAFRTGPELPRPGLRHSPRVAAGAKVGIAADICRQSLIDAFAPASILINEARECLYAVGPIGDFLDLSRGYPPDDMLDLVPAGLRMRLLSFLTPATGKEPVRIDGGLARTGHGFTVEIRHLDAEQPGLILLSFLPAAKAGGPPVAAVATSADAHKADAPKTDAPKTDAPKADAHKTDQQLIQARAELAEAMRALEVMAAEHKAVELEALSVNEEFQATNEELLASKEELQSLNEELSALNSQLQETLERQRATANDLQNILHSTDVATLFLDLDLNIRYFTPATRALFRVIQGDVGRPLADLAPRALDNRLVEDAQQVLATHRPRECEISTITGDWFIRRILPYQSETDAVEGLVITFTNISDRKGIASALEAAKTQAETANTAKSRFLAAASHDLRQPLQSLALLHGLLAKHVESEKGKQLIERFGQVLFTINGMMNTLLDINQIEAGVVVPRVIDFPVNDLLNRMRDDFLPNAQLQKLELRVVKSSRLIRSDPRLLEQIVRNLISNALKYTQRGKILIGCRQRQGKLAIEIWDTGIGIPKEQLKAIFQEYHQINNDARERNRGLGLGLAIVQRLGNLLGHPIGVRSRLGHGSVFAIEVALTREDPPSATLPPAAFATAPRGTRTGHLLIVEDDPTISDLLAMHLTSEGHEVEVFADGHSALARQASSLGTPDLLLADYNLPNGLDGLVLTSQLRALHGPSLPAIILTGDVSSETLQRIAAAGAVHRNKPVSMRNLSETIETLLSVPKAPHHPAPPADAPDERVQGHILIVDEDPSIRESLCMALIDAGWKATGFETGEALMAARELAAGDCLLLDAYLPGMSGLELLDQLRRAGNTTPAIIITGHSDVAIAVAAMKAGAFDFIEKPVRLPALLTCLERAREAGREALLEHDRGAAARLKLASLTPRQREIMARVLDGQPSKNIAADLHISQRTVENHRAAIMRKTGSGSLAALARLDFVAGGTH